LSEKTIADVLRDFGLTDKESKVYIFLVKVGVQNARDISRGVGMHKVQVYRALNSLQSDGLVESTLERPMRFTAVPFEKVLDLIIEAKREGIVSLEDKKSDLLAYLRSICVEKPMPPLEKFTIIVGISSVFSKALQMINEAKEEVFVITTSTGMIQADQAGIIETIKRRDIKFRVLVQISKENIGIIKRIIERISKARLNTEGRHVSIVSEICPCFLIKDDEEVIFLLSPKGDLSTVNRNSTCLWTNNRAVVHALKTIFEQLWRNATDLQKRIQETETGKPAVETLVIRDAQEAYRRFHGIVDKAEEEIIWVTSPKGMIRILGDHPVQQWFERGVKARIMSPIDVDNLEAAQELSKYCQVKHVDASYVRIAVVDNRHLFQSKAPPLDEETVELGAYFEKMLYSNEPAYVEGMREMLNDLWERALDISEIRSEAAMRDPVNVSTADPASNAIETMLRNNIGSVLVIEDNRPLGIITEKDILERVIKAKREPERTSAKEVMSTPLITIDAGKPLAEAFKVMRSNGIRRLAVTRDGNFVGILTERRTLAKFRGG